jgi:hypothetical protein
MKITKNKMNRLAANRRTYKEFGELTLRINMPDIPSTKLNRQTINLIDNFLKNINGIPLNNERLVFENNIVGTYQRKFKKENAREIIFDTSRYRRAQSRSYWKGCYWD